MSLQVATASFVASTPASGTLTAHRKLAPSSAGGFSSTGTALGPFVYKRSIIQVGGSYASHVNAIYRKNSDAIFVGAETSNNASVVMPSHQVLDLLVVIAVNTNGQTAPLVPANENWTILRQDSSSVYGHTIAYKHALSNTETAGIWVLSTRTTALVYRNVRQISPRTAFTNIASGYTNFHYPPIIGIQSTGGSRAVTFNVSENSVGNSTPPSVSLTNRISTDGAGFSAPGISVHDKLLPNGTASLQGFSPGSAPDTGSELGKQIAFSFVLLSGKPTIVQPTVDFSYGLNAQAQGWGTGPAYTLIARNREHEANITEFLFLYRQFFTAQTSSVQATFADSVLGKGFRLVIEAADFSYTAPDLTTARALRYGWPGLTPTPYSLAGVNPLTDLGFFIEPQAGSFVSTATASIVLTHNAYIAPLTTQFEHSLSATFIRTLIVHFITSNNSAFQSVFRQVGLRNDGLSITAGLASGTPPTTQGGSDSSTPSFLRTSFVRYSNVHSARDLGPLNNFLGELKGTVGGESGTNTIFIRLETLGASDIRFTKNVVNKYTDRFISIGVLDSNRKQVELNDYGFAYKNDIHNTDTDESLQSLPAGVYYFTISTNQWQRIPYSVTIQAIRFSAIEGVAQVSAALEARFAISKMRAAATLTAPLAATIPDFDILKQPTGPATFVAAFISTAVIPSGISTLRLFASGRLKMTHKINGAAGGSLPNVATLSSAPSYGGGGY